MRLCMHEVVGCAVEARKAAKAVSACALALVRERSIMSEVAAHCNGAADSCLRAEACICEAVVTG